MRWWRFCSADDEAWGIEIAFTWWPGIQMQTYFQRLLLHLHLQLSPLVYDRQLFAHFNVYHAAVLLIMEALSYRSLVITITRSFLQHFSRSTWESGWIDFSHTTPSSIPSHQTLHLSGFLSLRVPSLGSGYRKVTWRRKIAWSWEEFVCKLSTSQPWRRSIVSSRFCLSEMFPGFSLNCPWFPNTPDCHSSKNVEEMPSRSTLLLRLYTLRRIKIGQALHFNLSIRTGSSSRELIRQI